MQFGIVFVLIIVNGLFAMAEIAIVSARKARLQQAVMTGSGSARAALDLATSPNNFLSAVQIGITLIGILNGAIGEAALAAPVQELIDNVPALAPYSQTLALIVTVVVITYLSLVVGELVPKRLGLLNPERVAMLVAIPMRTLTRLTSPLVRILSASTDVVVRLLGVNESATPAVTEEEIKLMFAEGTRAGIFEAAEENILKRTLRLGDRPVAAIMTPRTEITWIDLEDPPEVRRQTMADQPFGRYPVGRGSIEQLVGVVQMKDLMAQYLAGQEIDLEAVLQPLVYVPENIPALKLLEVFESSRTHLALVVDEYGGLQGLVTLDDVLQGIVGDMPLAGEQDAPGAVQRDDGSWLVDGLLPIDEFREIFGLAPLPGEEEGDFQTVAGFVLSQLGHIPTVGDNTTCNDLVFEVMDMDGRRIDKVLVHATAGDPATPPS
jgi:putative hemolysin